MPSDRLIRVHHVVLSLQPGGLENGVVNVINRLDASRFESSVCCLKQAGEFARRIENPGVKVQAMGWPGGNDLRLPFRLARLFRESGARVVHTRNAEAFFYGFLGAKLAGVPAVVHSEHGRTFDDRPIRFTMQRWMSRFTQAVFTVSGQLKGDLVRHVGMPASRVEVLYNGVDLDRFATLDVDAAVAADLKAGADGYDGGGFGGGVEGGAEGDIGVDADHDDDGVEGMAGPDGDGAVVASATATGLAAAAVTDRCRLRASWGALPGEIVIGTVGRLVRVKNFGLLLRAVAASSLAAKLVFIGDGPEAMALRDLASQLGIAERVLFLGHRDDVHRLLPAFDVFVLPSLSEGMSNTLLEAMAAGVAPVVSDVGGNPEIVTDGVDGLVFASDDAAALTAQLRAIATDAPLRRRLARAARERVMASFDINAMVRRYEQLYDRVLARAA